MTCAFVLVVASAALVQDTPQYAPNHIIVKFKDGSTGPSPLPPGASASVERRFDSGAQLVRIGGLTVEEALARYASDSRVEYAEPDYIISIEQTGRNTPDDPRVGELWGLNNTGQTGGTVDADIDAAEAWTIQTGGDVLIGVVDTGIDWRHVDLAGNVWVNPGEIPGNHVDDDHNGFVDDVNGWDFVSGDNDPMDDNGHGTHVSGTIAAVGNNGVGVAGVCWKARLMAIKMLDANGTGTMSMAIAGVEYATRMGVRLMNESWGSTAYSRALEDALAAAADANVLIVAAAGNNARDNDYLPFYPSSYGYDNIIAVANTDANDTLSITSDYGVESVDVAAPGDRILSLLPGNRYGLLSGTSMATPHVSGTIALVLTEAPLMTPAQVKALLLATADRVPSLQGKVASGRLNAYSALAALDATPPGAISDLRVDETGSNTVTLTWTAVGDDGDVGTAAAYDVRYADIPIRPSNFDRAARVEDCPAPGAPGTRETLRVGGLDVKTTYFFAVRVLDERLNASVVSRMVAGRTRGEPEVSFAPDEFEGAALTGATAKQTLRISNVGKGTVDFSFSPSARGWVTAMPDAGTVGARETVNVTVTLDALGLAGGDYDDTITMTTNDPALPTVALPAHLTVTSAPHVVVSDAAVDFGAWFVGTGTRREIQVTNRGDRPLEVTAVELTDPDAAFGVDAVPTTLAPAAMETLAVSFTPAAPGVAGSTLRIASNDPDDPVATVALVGLGLPPPDVRVEPEGIVAELRTGGSTTREVTISNDGESDLEWRLSVETGNGKPTGEMPFRDLSGRRVLYDAAHSNLHWLNYTTVFDDLESRGAEVVISDSSYTRGYLDGFDVVWMADAFEPLSAAERDALARWVRAGGGLLLEGDYNETVPIFNGVLQELLCGVEMSLEDGTSGITNAIELHEVTRGVRDVYLSRVKASLPVLRPPAVPLIYDPEGVCNTAWSRSDEGRLVVMADQNFANHRMGKTGNENLANRVIDWLAVGVPWLGASTWSGVLAPSQSRTVTVRIDAIGIGGPHDARLVVWSNDPDEPEAPVPVHLDAKPAPGVFVGAAEVQFPPTGVLQTSRHDVLVGNIGTVDLEVKGVSSSSTEFAAAPSAFSLPPGASTALTITYAPLRAGEDAAVVTLDTNDPNAATVTIRVGGEAVEGTSARTSLANVVTPQSPPERTALHPNVPNPFNPSTTIAYDVRDAATVTIAVYDVRGRLVRTLVHEEKPPGRYATLWDGTDDGGVGVASGIYFCRFVAGEFTQTEKIVLLK